MSAQCSPRDDRPGSSQADADRELLATLRLNPDRVSRPRLTTVGADGKVALRHAGKLRHLAVGRAHKRTYVMLLIDDRDVRVLSAENDGGLLATFRIDPAQLYQPWLTP